MDQQAGRHTVVSRLRLLETEEDKQTSDLDRVVWLISLGKTSYLVAVFKSSVATLGLLAAKSDSLLRC
uniref:Uncharacterized protein n=1 Tax=Arion vulgaris TaxID=1028688 RepID=A0A0B6Y7Q3_9EUPU